MIVVLPWARPALVAPVEPDRWSLRLGRRSLTLSGSGGPSTMGIYGFTAEPGPNEYKNQCEPAERRSGWAHLRYTAKPLT